MERFQDTVGPHAISAGAILRIFGGETETMKEKLTLLTIEDEAIVRRSIRDFFEDSGFEVLEAGEAESGLSLFREKRPEVVLVDLRMPGISGLEVIDALVEEAPETPVVVLSGAGVIADAMDAIRRGAWDFVAKPITDMTQLEHVIRKAMERARLREENRRYREHLEEEVTRRTRELSELNHRLKGIVHSTRIITACTSMEDLGRQLLEEFSLNMGAEGGSLYFHGGWKAGVETYPGPGACRDVNPSADSPGLGL